MAREWIEYVQSQHLPWQAGALPVPGSAMEYKCLSADHETGATSLLIRYPAGYRLPAGRLGVDEEFLVLDGRLEVGDLAFDPYGYAHWPAGYGAGERRAPRGAVVLTFYSASPLPAQPAASPADPARLVECCDTFAVPYTGNFHPEFPPGAGRKLLYQDAGTGDTSWILGTMPMRWAERSEQHDAVEEMYLLSGEVHGDRGVMRPGAYFWRPPHLRHGPYGTLTGNLYFFRTKGGPLRTEYVTPERPFRWWPEYTPVLPERLSALAQLQHQGLPRCW
jgi:hypothetical protein